MKRIEWIDTTKFICIFLVMITHLECCSKFFLNLYHPFYLSLFFFCSGYCYKLDNDFKHFISKKSKTLLLPWFIYSNANILISQIVSIKEHKDLSIELFRNLLQVRYFDDKLWFLPSLFITFIPFYFIVKQINKDENKANKYLFLVIVLFFIKKIYSEFMPGIFMWQTNKLPWHIDYIPTALLSMYLGYYFKIKFENQFDSNNAFNKRVCYSLVYIMLVSFPYVYNLNLPFVIYAVYDFVGQVLGIFVVISWCKVIVPNRYILYVGANTLLYFCLHNKFLTVFEYLIKNILPNFYGFIMSNEALSIIISIIIVFVVSLILIIPIELINRYLPWTIGKKTKI